MAWGHTQAATMDAALDVISTYRTEAGNALDEIGAFLLKHPEFDDDEHLTVARLALL